MPTDFCSHSMLHQTLLTFSPFSSSSSSSSFHHSLSSSPAILSSSFSPSAGRFLSSSSSSSSQVEMEAMKGMLASAHEQVFMVDEVDEAAWAAERVNLLAEEFQVDDLLDLRGLPESEQDEMEEEEEDEDAVPIAVSEASVSPVKSTPAVEKDPLELCSEICLPETDAAALEWVSRFFDDSSAEFPPPLLPGPALAPLTKYSSASAATPPASISCTTAAAGSLSTEAVFPVKAKRSKRLRGDGGVWSRSAPPRLSDASSASSITTTAAAASSPSSSSCSSSSFTSYISYYPSPAAGILLDDNPAPFKEHKPKKRGRKPKNPSAALGERRCTHCGVQKTPQWRAGPRGAKTLCNACGVRYKSGRLLPEYRPACSPTYLSDIHSNSHRKVLEMRRKKEEHEVLARSVLPVPTC